MKELLKIMRFDFLTAKPLALGVFIIAAVLFSLLSLFFSPVICAYITFGALMFVIPLQNIADKSDFNKLYGILPVQRKNITRARFMYIFFVHFLSELFEVVMIVISMSLKLYRVLPNQNGEMMQMVRDSFSDTSLVFVVGIGMFSLFCLMFGYVEMMGQIFGRENEMKIILITLGVLSVLAMGFLLLADHDIIPTFKLPNLPTTLKGKVILSVIINIVMFGLCLLFGEITARKLAKREL